MSAASPVSNYRANLFVGFSLCNPFMGFPDTAEAPIHIANKRFITRYVPKIEDLLEIAKAKKFHLFKAMIHSHLFDHNTTPQTPSFRSDYYPQVML